MPCGMCGSTDLWDDNLNCGCNVCGAWRDQDRGFWFFFGEPSRKEPLRVNGQVVDRCEYRRLTNQPNITQTRPDLYDRPDHQAQSAGLTVRKRKPVITSSTWVKRERRR
jgi:hypothetical protein